MRQAQVVNQIARGLQRKRARGEQYGHAPYGWRFEGGRRVEEPAEQETIRLVLAHDAEGLSLRESAERLREARRFRRSGRPFHYTDVGRLRRAAT